MNLICEENIGVTKTVSRKEKTETWSKIIFLTGKRGEVGGEEGHISIVFPDQDILIIKQLNRECKKISRGKSKKTEMLFVSWYCDAVINNYICNWHIISVSKQNLHLLCTVLDASSLLFPPRLPYIIISLLLF